MDVVAERGGPDKGRFEKDTALINGKIKELENKLVSFILPPSYYMGAGPEGMGVLIRAPPPGSFK